MNNALFIVQRGPARVQYIVHKSDHTAMKEIDLRRIRREWGNAKSAFPNAEDEEYRIRWMSCAGYEFSLVNDLPAIVVSA